MPRLGRRSRGPIEEEETPDIGRVCEKCDGTFIFGPNFHRTQLDCDSLSPRRKEHLKEHLHFQCRCGFDWTEPCGTGSF